MYEALVITPVKNSIETTKNTIASIKKTRGSFLYRIYNDFSSIENTEELLQICIDKNIELLNLENFTINPSPNYRLILELAQKEALKLNAPLIIVESDVTVFENTLSELLLEAKQKSDCGIIGCVTIDETGVVNYPYKKIANRQKKTIKTKHSVSFCCTLLTLKFLASFDFSNLPPKKHWFDIFISRKSIQLGFFNYVMIQNPVIHLPHSSRPWKLLKYKNPLKYYWIKLTKRLDRI
jgi:hypothetical protein